MPRRALAAVLLSLIATTAGATGVLAGPTTAAVSEHPSAMQVEDQLHRNDRLDLPPAAYGPTAGISPSPAGRSASSRAVYNNSGLTREVFGYAPYWALSSGALSDIQLNRLSTIAYFGLDIQGDGSFDQSAGNGGWTGWNSQALANLVQRAHASGDRVVLVGKQFNEATICSIVSSNNSAGAGGIAINNLIAAAKSRSMDGINIDFEGTASACAGAANVQTLFTSWIASLSQALRQQMPGATLTVATYSGAASWDGGFMNIGALAPSVDAFFIMAYDMYYANSQDAGKPITLPNSPLAGPYTYTDTKAIDQYLAKVGNDGSKVILGIPYYGYKYSTTSTVFNAPVNSSAGGVADGCQVTCPVAYTDVRGDLACAQQLATNWDSQSSTPWVSWYSPSTGDPCGANRGSYRETYYDDARSIGLKYDLVNARGIRGAGIWALGDDHGFTDLWDVIGAKFATPAPPPGSNFHPLPPTRVLDTRASSRVGDCANGAAGNTCATLGPDAGLDVRVTGLGGVPASGVTEVVLNATVTEPTASGYLTVSAAGSARPATSNLNFKPGHTVANLVVVPVGPGGRVDVYNRYGNTDVVLDLAGFMGGAASPDGRFRAASPARILDTRAGFGGTTLRPGQSLDLQVSGASGSQVPTNGAEAVVLNLTATNPTGPGYLSVFPAGSSVPLASNLNFTRGQTVPNRAIVKLGGPGAVTIYNFGADTDVVVDVNGWFTDASDSTASAGLFHGLAPARVYDSRSTGGPLGPGQTRPVSITNVGGVPPLTSQHVGAVVANLTVTDTSAGSYLTAYPTGATRPNASDLNWIAGQTVPNLSVVAPGPDGSMTLYNLAGAVDLVVDVFGWFD